MQATINDDWIRHFRESGYPQATGLGVGMEGAVYLLKPGELVAKIWRMRTERDLETLRRFYQQLPDAGPTGIRTPRIIDIEIVRGTLVSTEQFLPGTPLDGHLNQNARVADASALDSTVAVLRYLRSVSDCLQLRLLPVLDEGYPLWRATGASWSDAVAALVSRRLARFGHQLRTDVPDLSVVEQAATDFLRTRDSAPMSLIHGDLCGANIMVDENGKASAVFDFGFLSTVGDSALDASISSAIFNMYGPHAAEVEEQVTTSLARELGYDVRVLSAYKAIYCMITSNAYSPDNTDGHYQWCVRMLRRADVREALGIRVP